MKIKKENGITLVALVITIIILLLLAGIAIATLGGENGIFAKVKLSKEKYSMSEAKEKLELAISTARIEEEGKGEKLTIDKLGKIDDDKISVGDTSKTPVDIICKDYKFSVDSDFNITYVGKVEGTVITYTTEPEGYTNKDEVKILIRIKNPKGIKTIQCPNEDDKIIANGQTEVGMDYKVSANGVYIFKVVDNDNVEVSKNIFIDKIDKVEPKDFTPDVEEVKSTSFTIVANVEDGDETDVSTKSGIEKYEFFVNETKYESTDKKYQITGLSKNTSYSIYVIAYDKAGNYKKSSLIIINTTSGGYPILTLNGMVEPDDDLAVNALGKGAYDNDFTTYETYSGTHRYYKIDPECWGKYITFYSQTSNDYTGGVLNFGSSYNKINDIKADWMYILSGVGDGQLCSRSVMIPEGCYWGAYSTGRGSTVLDISEVWCSTENLSGQVYSNDNRPQK